MTEIPSNNDNLEKLRYLCRVIDDGHYTVDLKWKNFIDLAAIGLNLERDEILSLLQQDGIGYQGDEEANFLVAGVFSADLESREKEAIFQRLLGEIEKNDLMRNLLLLISLDYDFTLALLEFLLRSSDEVIASYRDNPYLPLITCDFFIESRTTNSFVKHNVGKLSIDMGRIQKLISNEWFMNLLTILKSGLSVNQNIGFEGLVENEANSSSGPEINSLIEDGTFPALVMNRNSVLKQDFVIQAFRRRFESERHVRKLHRFYYWLGIANDFILGVLFLVGSIEFIPNYGNEYLGVVMFIIGSAQLVGRSVIQIVMNLHVKSHRKKSMSGNTLNN